MTTRREIITQCGLGIAGIIVAKRAPAAVVRSLLGGRDPFTVNKEIPTCADYIQDGGTMMYDGIENAGWGEHADSNCVDLWGMLGQYNTENITSNSFFLGKSQWMSGKIPKYTSIIDNCNTNGFTYELVFTLNTSIMPNRTNIYPIGTGGWADRFSIKLEFAIDSHPNYSLTSISTYLRKTNSQTEKYTRINNGDTVRILYIKKANTLTIKVNDTYHLNNVTFAPTGDGNYNGIYLAYNRTDPFLEVHSMRLYDRALTDEEAEWNYKIDKARFGI